MGAGAGTLLLALLLARGAPQEPESRIWDPLAGPMNTRLFSKPCGERENKPLIVGGVESVRGRWPWMVSLIREKKQVCGGSLLNRRWVMSAAHCFAKYADVDSWRVQVGQLRTGLLSATWSLDEVIRVNKTLPFPLHLGTANDVAVVELASRMTYSPTACSPPPSWNPTADCRRGLHV